MGLSEFRGGHRDGAGHATGGAGEEGQTLYAHLAGLHGSGYADSFFARGGNASKTGQFEGEGRMKGSGHIVGSGHATGGDGVSGGFIKSYTKSKLRSLLKKIKKSHPEAAAKADMYLAKLGGAGRLSGCGWWQDLLHFIAQFFGSSSKSSSKPSESSESSDYKPYTGEDQDDYDYHNHNPPPSRSESPSRESSVKDMLAAVGITDKKSFRKWALKNHPDKGGDVANFQKYSGLAGQMGWSGGKRMMSKSDGRLGRAQIVKKVMAEKGLSMIEASKYVKAHGLYKK
jgi:hypothetical protein